VLVLLLPLGVFQSPKPTPGGPATVFPRKEAQPHGHYQTRVQRTCTELGIVDDCSAREDLPVTIKCAPQRILFSGVGCRKGPNSVGKMSTVGVLRLRARSPWLSDRSARRFAPTAGRGRQDDGLVGVLKNLLVGCVKTTKNQKSHNLSG
jgi:hypothetical protein